MKRILMIVMLFLFAGLPLCAQHDPRTAPGDEPTVTGIPIPQGLRAPRGFAGKLWSGAMVLYGQDQNRQYSICTAEPYQKIEGGYLLMSAGHCKFTADTQFSVASEIGETPMPVTLLKARHDDDMDFATFELKTKKHYPVFQIGTDDNLRVGDEVININFTLGLGKQLSKGTISSQPLVASDECEKDCIGSFLVQLSGAGPGASGSVVVSKKTHRIIGMVIGEWTAPLGFGVEPISRFAKFLAEPVPVVEDKTVTIDPIEFQKLFGEAHPFPLTVHGPDPVFIHEGYKFQVGTEGFDLSDEFYYDVPVFIGVDESGYRLVSTAEDMPSVSLTVLGKP